MNKIDIGVIMAYYKSYGAAGEVTGSCHYLHIGKIKILIDCGMFQGSQESLNFEPFAFDPRDIDYLIVTHAHLDHIGRIPLLVKEGFNKQIISTKATYSIAKLMLRNSAGILEAKKEKLYTQEDVEPALKLFGSFLESNDSMILDENIKISFKNAGHILGAVSVKLEFFDEGIEKSIVFSGDIGQTERIITSSIEYWENANYVFVESTYGASIHENLHISKEDFKQKVLNTINNGGTVVIPSFALERTQELLYLFNDMSNKGLLENIPVYLDSPLAIDVTKTFLDYPQLFSKEVQESLTNDDNPFYFDQLIQTYSIEASLQINHAKGPKIVIAGSGMCEGGRVGYHILRYANDPKNLILFVGYQVESTLGRKIKTGNQDVKIMGSNVNIAAQVDYIAGFSAHADQQEILQWINSIEDLYCVYLIHGDMSQLQTLKQKVKNELQEKVHIVKLGEMIHI